MPAKKTPCISDKENLEIPANHAEVKPQTVKAEVTSKPPVDEFDDDDAVEALIEAEACSSPV